MVKTIQVADYDELNDFMCSFYEEHENAIYEGLGDIQVGNIITELKKFVNKDPKSPEFPNILVGGNLEDLPSDPNAHPVNLVKNDFWIDFLWRPLIIPSLNEALAGLKEVLGAEVFEYVVNRSIADSKDIQDLDERLNYNAELARDILEIVEKE